MPNEKSLSLFQDMKVIGELPPRRIASKLRQMGDPATADEMMQRATPPGAERLFSLGPPKPWQHTTHQFGYLPLQNPTSPVLQPIQYAGAIEADLSLKNQRLNIFLDRLRVYDYPGGGQHNIMFNCAARNQSSGGAELISFSQTYRVQEGQLAGVEGYPIFIGLHVGTLGAAFECSTINVKNDADESILEALESPPFKGGLICLRHSSLHLHPLRRSR